MYTRYMQKLIVANWKMNPGSATQARLLFAGTVKVARAVKNAKTIVCPPFVFIPLLHSSSSRVFLGAQDVFFEREGAHTGEISPGMLASAGVSHVVIGHSERRRMGETNVIVAKKSKAARAHHITPIICVGEDERDDEGKYLSFIKLQLAESLALIARKDAAALVIAYEPVWAIGEHALRADTPEEFLEIAIFIRKTLADMYGKNTAEKIPVLYGGSVNEKNASGFLEQGKADGLLVGRASLGVKKFGEILAAADHAGR